MDNEEKLTRLGMPYVLAEEVVRQIGGGGSGHTADEAYDRATDALTAADLTAGNLEVVAAVPFSKFSPPIDGLTDALPAFQAAMAYLSTMQASRKALDLEGLTYSVSDGIINAVPGSEIRNGRILATGTREAWAGGTPAKDGLPVQKGVVRRFADDQRYTNLSLGCGPWSTSQVVTANSVYTVWNTLANGFEDAPVSGGNRAKVVLFKHCLVDDPDSYSYRYASDTGGGFDLDDSRARKRPTMSPINADADTGCHVYLDSNDGFVRNCTFLNSHYPIHQVSGGTIQLRGNHPWRGPAIYTRRYFGTVGTVIETGIQIRTLGQIGAYDPALVSVTRRATDWQVIVTLLQTIPQETAAEVRIRRDEVLAYMQGWGSYWDSTYIDGGTLRFGTGGHVVKSGEGLAGAMTDTFAEFVTSTLTSVFEFLPNGGVSTPPLDLDWDWDGWNKHMIRYPRLNQSSFSTNNMLYPDATIEARRRNYGVEASEMYSRDAAGVVTVMRSNRTATGFKVVPFNVSDADGPLVLFGTGAPSIAAPRGSVYFRYDATGQSAYIKNTATASTVWDPIVSQDATTGEMAIQRLVSGARAAVFRSASGSATAAIGIAHASATDTDMTQIFSGNYAPEGNLAAGVGSLFLRRNGGAGTSIYVKESGTGNTGWVGK